MIPTGFSSSSVEKQYLDNMHSMLLKNFGVKKWYNVEHLKVIHEKSSWKEEINYLSWAMSIFCSRYDFKSYHSAIGKKYHYQGMRKLIMGSVIIVPVQESTKFIPSVFDIFDSALEILDIITSIFDIFN